MRIQRTFLVFISRLIASILPGLLSLLLNYLVISRYGSDVNGLIATIAQFTGLLTIFEGGFSLATNVALYKPYIEKREQEVNEILSATRVVYLRLGSVTTLVIAFLAILAPYFLKTDVDRQIISLLVIITTSHLAINFFVFSKYSVIFNASQQEYLLEFIQVIVNILSQIVSIGLIYLGSSFIVFKLVALIIPIFRYPVIKHFIKTKFPQINYKSPIQNFQAIKTTGHVFIQNIASIIFSSTDILILSIVIGTKIASVYAVYSFVYAFVKGILMAMTSAPFNAFGQIHSEGNLEDLSTFFKIYQWVTISISTIFLISVQSVILPFIKLYTSQVKDILYVIPLVAFLFSINAFFEIYLNIFGSIANSSGRFKEMRNIALIGAIINLGLSLLLVNKFGIVGVLMGTLVAYIIMMIQQSYLVNVKILNHGMNQTLKMILINGIVLIVSFYLTNLMDLEFSGYMEFLYNGVIIFILCTLIVGGINSLLNIPLFKMSFEFYRSSRKSLKGK